MPPLTRHPQEARYASFVAGELLSNPKVCFGHQGSAECAQCACVTRPLSPQLLSTLLAEEWPAWLRSSHYDRCDWLSAALQALWPSVERSLSRRVQVVAVPSLEALAPGFVRRVRIEDLSLGSCAPRVTGVLCADDPDGSARGVELEVEAQWQCDGHAQLAFDLRPGRRITCGIHDLSVKGVLRLRLGPYSSSLPGFSAVAVCFASPPAVRYRLSGVGALATSIPGFNAYLQQCVADALAAACVWPRRLVLPLPGASPGASARNPPAGVLRVTVHEAVDLSPAELLGLKDVALPGSSAQSTSPYVVLELPECPGGGAVGLQREASQHRRNTLSPRFDGQAFHFVVDDPATQRLRVSVRAWDAQGAGPATGSVMGEATLPLGGLHPGVEDTDAWALTLVVPKSVTVQGVMATYRVPSFGGELQELPAGRIRLGLLYTPFAPDNDGDDQLQPGRTTRMRTTTTTTSTTTTTMMATTTTMTACPSAAQEAATRMRLCAVPPPAARGATSVASGEARGGCCSSASCGGWTCSAPTGRPGRETATSPSLLPGSTAARCTRPVSCRGRGTRCGTRTLWCMWRMRRGRSWCWRPLTSQAWTPTCPWATCASPWPTLSPSRRHAQRRGMTTARLSASSG